MCIFYSTTDATYHLTHSLHSFNKIKLIAIKNIQIQLSIKQIMK